MISPSFELASEKDAEALVAIEQQVGELKTYGKPVTLDEASEQLRTSQFYFIRMGNVTVGTAALRIRADNSVYFSNIAVLPAHRGHGIGRAAMSFLLAKSDKASRIDLVTHPENVAALRLYISSGFTVESRKENYFGDQQAMPLDGRGKTAQWHYARIRLPPINPPLKSGDPSTPYLPGLCAIVGAVLL